MNERSEQQSMPKIGPNDILRFLLELFAFVSLGIWGFLAFPLPWPGVLVGLGAPALAILVWALFVSPKHTIDTPRPVAFGIELVVWAAASAALASTGHVTLGVVFLAVSVVSGALNYAWR